ncbi:hypothetical protein [Otoolea muris]|uniref:hypothetical protein n=1 Tax=Otoolea muris TaxID=2941515 RepID=UPI00203F8DC4|nr:hypothetical protein [Otoolea muris]
MKGAEEIRKTILSSDTEEVAKILETLDENSIVLARTYMTALADRQKIEKAKLAAAAI